MRTIYALIDPITNEVRYVGQTAEALPDRLQGHLHDGVRTHKGHWVRKLKKAGLAPRIEALEVAEDGDEAERWWIAYLRFIGCRLTNHYAGGNGLKEHTERTKKKIVRLLKGRNVPEERRKAISATLTGRKRPQHEKDKIRATLTGRKMKPEWVRAYVASRRAGKGWQQMKGVKRPPFSDTWRANMSAAQKGKKLSAETRAKIGAAGRGNTRRLGHKASDETRAKMSAAHKGKPKGPFSETHKMSLRFARRRFLVYKILQICVDSAHHAAKLLSHGPYTVRNFAGRHDQNEHRQGVNC